MSSSVIISTDLILFYFNLLSLSVQICHHMLSSVLIDHHLLLSIYLDLLPSSLTSFSDPLTLHSQRNNFNFHLQHIFFKNLLRIFLYSLLARRYVTSRQDSCQLTTFLKLKRTKI